MFDSSSVVASELLSFFGRNTAIEIDHRYGTKECAVISTRTKNVIGVITIVDIESDTYNICVGETWEDVSLEFCAELCKINKRFPRNRKMNRTWSPIRLTAKAEADREITRATLAWTAE